jgi:hypothetical protein
MNRYALPLQIFICTTLVMGLSLTARAVDCKDTPTFYSPFNERTYVTITKRGNITHFLSPVDSPPNINAGYDHIGGASSSEGYVLSYLPFNGAPEESAYLAYDVGDGAQSNFEQETSDCSPELVTITRKTSFPAENGVLQLTQVIQMDSNADGPTKQLRVKMIVKNVSPVVTAYEVVLRRQVDFNIDGRIRGDEGVDPSHNFYATTGNDGVFAWNIPESELPFPHGMMLRSIIRPNDTTPGTVFAKVTQNPHDITRRPPNYAFLVNDGGDYGATLQYELGTLAPGQTKTVQVEYARF